jgi:sterol desaturase/sphingolipid hydroxylase (fatty acid hydroxylase superfamily)
MHFITYYTWVFVGIMKAVSDHCGYGFPWSPFAITTPGRTYAEFHSFHHSNNVGNFASIYPINDYLWGTSKNYYKFQNARGK